MGCTCKLGYDLTHGRSQSHRRLEKRWSLSASHSAAAVAAAAAAAAACVPAGGCVCQSGLSRARRLPWSMGAPFASTHPAGSRSGRQTPSAVSVREKVSQGQQMMGPSGGSSQTATVGKWKRPAKAERRRRMDRSSVERWNSPRMEPERLRNLILSRGYLRSRDKLITD